MAAAEFDHATCGTNAAGVITVTLSNTIPAGTGVTCRAINFQASQTYAQFYPTGANYQVHGPAFLIGSLGCT